MLTSHVGLVVAVRDSPDMERFHHQGKFYGAGPIFFLA